MSASPSVRHINYYDAYGNERRETVSDNPFAYCGEYTDEESGLIYLRGRYYDPTVGRFISEDPIKDGANWYAYCAGNPMKYVDPWGLAPVMLRYIVEKNGGVVSYNAQTQTAIVEYGAGTYEFKGEIVNGRIIVDSAEIGNKLRVSDTTHKEGDVFYSADDAALAFGLTYLEKSKHERIEYGANINKVGENTYALQDVANSKDNWRWNNLDEYSDNDFMRNQVPVFGRENTVAMAHTHWRKNGNKTFSNPQDYDVTFGNYSQVSSIYLVNSSEEVVISNRVGGGTNHDEPEVIIKNIYKGDR